MTLAQARDNMIKQQLRTNNIHNDLILNLYKNASREQFVPEAYKQFSYSDMHIPLEHQQVMLTPLEEAKMIQSAQLSPKDNVLEIGTGTGFLTTLLAQVCNKVVSIEYHADLVIQAKKNISKQELTNIELLHLDANHLTTLEDKFDAIICTSGLESIPEHWLNLLKPKGRIFAPIGCDSQNAQWIYFENNMSVGHEFVFTSKLPLFISGTTTSKFIF